MAWSGVINCKGVYDVWSKFIRYIIGDPSIPGRDWEVLRCDEEDDSTVLQNDKFFRGYLNSISQDIFLELPTITPKDYVFFKNNYQEVVGTGDGSTQTFSFTLSNLPAYKSIKLTATINGSEVVIYENPYESGSFLTPYLYSSSIDYTTGVISLEFVTPPDDGTSIIVDYSTSTLVEGVDYEVDYYLGYVKFLSSGSTVYGEDIKYFYNCRRTTFFVKNTGSTGNETVILAFKFITTKEESMGFIGLNSIPEFDLTYSTWNDGVPYSGGKILSLGFWNDDSYLFISSTKDRIIIFNNSNNMFSNAYIGLLRRASLPNEYPVPIYITADCYTTLDMSSYVDYSSTSSFRRNFLFREGVVFTPNSSWFQDTTDFGGGNTIYILPTTYNFNSNVVYNYHPTANKILFPVYIYVNYYPYDVCGSMIDVAWCPGDDLSSGDEIIDSEGNKWFILSNFTSTNSTQFMAIKEV